MKITRNPAEILGSHAPFAGGDPLLSFAALLESGLSAKDVEKVRARSFAESGMLGNYYAHMLGEGEPVNLPTKAPPLSWFKLKLAGEEDGGQSFAKKAFFNEVQLLLDIGHLPDQHIQKAGESQQQSVKATQLGRPTEENRFILSDVKGVMRPLNMQISALTGVHNSRIPHIFTSFYQGQSLSPKISLWGKNEDLTVLFEENFDNPNSDSKIGLLAKRILLEFGVTNYRLLDSNRSVIK
ncbi:MAG: hypothetical protein HC843_11040 [Sphingomonadales bacterium]|nr:hypothetical protein [Sphingomonadales bacterium]